ncbi:MAG: hypothetical protein EZS28_004530 [Streblomastix strix]|uniref:non-specific serine/threonine protein kinase n=1 Tax=Streblomastix strix TaxID=222440 RepID=A0A5J4WZN3_9EUKA|nr:MAG: hypothetical protein EZS28_004530 [Streblomastix strix]
MEQEQQLLKSKGFQVIRKGGFGRVYEVHKQDLGVVAAKVMEEENFNFREWQEGVKLTQNIQNPFAVQLIESLQTKEYAVIVTEYANLGNLENITTSNKFLPIPVI